MDDILKLFWAKTCKNDESVWHALYWHMIDSGLMAKNLLLGSLSESFKRDVAELLSLPQDQAVDLVSFWVSLHDIGKCGPEFQRKYYSGRIRLEAAGLSFPACPEWIDGYHAWATTWILEEYWKATTPAELRFTNALSIALGGHHGEFPSTTQILDSPYRKYHLGDEPWRNIQKQFIQRMESIFAVPLEWYPPKRQAQINSLLMLITGLTTIADWIASDSAFFEYDAGNEPVQDYLCKSQREAEFALRELGWNWWKASGSPGKFEQEFPFPPNALQKAFIRETENLASPFLTILEAPTGSGKTESALFLADTSVQKEKKSGFYIAMPSQATSNQMFERTVSFLKKRYPGNKLNIQLVHGSALIDETFKKLHIQNVNQDKKTNDDHIAGKEWFLPRKKSLLSPFGIGTVDQAFLSVMSCRHFYLRLFGLAHKVVIFDEVHAYDVYMLEIFKRLLGWLRAMNTSVIILSATLPASSRCEMLEAYAGRAVENDIERVPFPRLSFCTSEQTRVVSLGNVTSRSVSIEWQEQDRIIDTLHEKLFNGGHAAIIVNRVDSAIEIFEKLLGSFSSDELIVFHSRFPYCHREKIENGIKGKYGKNIGKRPKSRSIVIATQVIEQSLDLDFDLMISNLAPVDSLIQRIGRLHRHADSDNPPVRPENLKKPHFILIKPDLRSSPPSFGLDEYIYAPYILQRTWFVLQNRADLQLPGLTDELIEKVYSELPIAEIPPELWDKVETAGKKMVGMEEDLALKASNQLVRKPENKLLGNFQATFNEGNDAQSMRLMQTLTRNAGYSIQVVCLEQTPAGLFTLDRHQPINLDSLPDAETIAACQRSSLTIHNRGLVNHFLEQHTPVGWEKCAALRAHIPLVFTDGHYHKGSVHLILDEKKGICHEKEATNRKEEE